MTSDISKPSLSWQFVDFISKHKPNTASDYCCIMQKNTPILLIHSAASRLSSSLFLQSNSLLWTTVHSCLDPHSGHVTEVRTSHHCIVPPVEGHVTGDDGEDLWLLRIENTHIFFKHLFKLEKC